MLEHRGSNSCPDKSNEQSDQASSSQDRSDHSARESFLRLRGLNWERGQTSSPNERSDQASSSQNRSDHPARESFLRLRNLNWERGQTSSSNERSDQASSSQNRSDHPARRRSLLPSCFHPDTWEHGQTSSGESSTSAEQQLLQQEQREQNRRERLPLLGRLEKLNNFEQKHKSELGKLENKVGVLEALVEKHWNDHSNENNLHRLYKGFQDLDCMSLAQVQWISDKEKTLTWVEKMTEILERDAQSPIHLQHHQRLKLLESQERLQKKWLDEMNKQLRQIKMQLKNAKMNEHNQIPELSQECINQLSITHQEIEVQKNIIRQQTKKIETLGEDGKILDSHKYTINQSLSRQAAERGPIFNKIISSLEKYNTDMNHRELPLKQRIQWLSEMVLKIDSVQSDPSKILQHIELIGSKKVNEWAEQNRQLDQRLNDISSRIKNLFGQHSQILQIAEEKLKIDLPGPKTVTWNKFKYWIYEDPEEIFSKFFSEDKPFTDGHMLILEDILVKDGKSKRVSDEQRKDLKYQEFAELIVKAFQDFQDDQNKGKRPAQS